MKYVRIVGTVLLLLMASFVKEAFAQDHVAIVGNAVGEISKVSGPATVRVDLGNCQFSIALSEGDHAEYNDPDLVLYRASHSLADQDLPHLKQAEMTSGYDWWFEEPKAARVRWVGLMCGNTSDFRWSSSPMRSEVSPELQDIMDSNSLKCPADFDGKKWTSFRKGGGANFEDIDVPGASGFAVDIKSKSGIQGSRFCFVNGENVLIGMSGGGTNIQGEKRSKDSFLYPLLRNIKFKSDVMPTHQQ
jgi:hypothetical protein